MKQKWRDTDMKNRIILERKGGNQYLMGLTGICATVQFSSVTQSCPTLCDPMDCSTWGCVSITNSQSSLKLVSIKLMLPSQPSNPLSSLFPLSQHQGPFNWVSFSHQVAKVLRVSASASVLPMNIQDWFPLGWTGWISLQSKGLSRVFFNITVQKQQFFIAQPSLWSNSHIHTWLLEKQ